MTLGLAVVATIVGVLAGGAATGGDPASWAAVEVPSGRTVPVLERGVVRHVVFFATWCPPCVAELPRLAELEARYGESGYELAVVAVSARQSLDRLAAFWESHNVPGKLLFDADGALERALTVDGVPTHLVFDADGVEVLRAGSVREGVREVVEQRVHEQD